jgi:hypothetical protein
LGRSTSYPKIWSIASTQVFEEQLGNCDPPVPPLGVPVYAPVSGCILRDSVNLTVVIIAVNCEGFEAYPDGRREIALTHLDPNTIQQWPVAGVDPAVGITAGQLVGNLCRNETKLSCGINSDAIPTHLAVSVRFYQPVGIFTAALDSEVLGFDATPSCLFDEWDDIPGLPTSNPNSYHACPQP